MSLCKYLYENRSFYLNVLEYTGQNCLRDYLLDFYSELCENRIKAIYGNSVLKSPEYCLLARLEAHSYVGIIMDWVKAGMNDNYLQYFDYVKSVSYNFSSVPENRKLCAKNWEDLPLGQE